MASTALLRRYVEEPDTGVRSLDALHLAAVRRVGGASVPLVTFDLRQAQAARTLGLTVLGA